MTSRLPSGRKSISRGWPSKIKQMRKKRNQKFKVEVVYKDVPDKKDRVRQLWDTLVSLPDPEDIKQEKDAGNKNNQKS